MFMFIMCQSLAFPAYGLSILTWFLSHLPWNFKPFSWSFLGCVYSCGTVWIAIGHIMLWVSFLALLDKSIVSTFLPLVIMQYISLCARCICVKYLVMSDWSCNSEKVLRHQICSQSHCSDVIVYWICISCCTLLAYQSLSLWWYRVTSDDQCHSSPPLCHVPVVHHPCATQIL